MPRPTRFAADLLPAAGFNVFNRMLRLLLAFNTYHVRDFVDHASYSRCIYYFHAVPNSFEP
jgi:hypothetical protein